MTFGSKFCIDKLREDLLAVEEIIRSLSSLVTSKTIYSWKFSHSSALDVDIYSMIEKIKYSAHNVHANQIFHVVLLEFIIDRILVVFQMLGYFNSMVESEKLVSFFHEINSVSSCIKLHMPFLLVNKITDDFTSHQYSPLQNDVSNSTSLKPGLAADALKWIDEVEEHYNPSLQNFQAERVTNYDYAVQSKAVQTESESSGDMQFHNYWELIEFFVVNITKIMDICDLPSEIGLLMREKFSNTFIKEVKTDGYKSLISTVKRDISRLFRHLKLQTTSRNSMQKELHKIQTEKERLTNNLKQLKDEYRISSEDLASQLQKVKAKSADANQKIAELIENLKCRLENFTIEENRVKDLEIQIQNYNREKVEIQKLLKGELVGTYNSFIYSEIRSYLADLHQKISNLTTQLENMQTELSTKNTEKENLVHQLNTIRIKQEKFNEKINQLSNLNDQLKNQAAENALSLSHWQSKVDSYEKTIKNYEDHYQNISIQMREIDKSKQMIETELVEGKLENVKLKKQIGELEKNILLVSQYPDLNGPIISNNINNIETDTIESELDGQIEANELRIALLVEQTKRLRNARVKISRNKCLNSSQSKLNNSESDFPSEEIGKTINNKSDEIDSGRKSLSNSRKKTYTKIDNSNIVNTSVHLWSGPNTKITCQSSSSRGKKI